MLIDFQKLNDVTIPHLNDGAGSVCAKMSIQKDGKLMLARIGAGSSIGMHTHTTSDDINYVLSGTGKAVCDGAEETLSAGICHVCPKGSCHSIENTGTDDLVLFTVVVEQ